MEFPITLAYNMEDKKVGCVLLQPCLGATCPHGVISSNFDSGTWELSPTKLKLYTVKTQEEFDKIVEITHKAHKK